MNTSRKLTRAFVFLLWIFVGGSSAEGSQETKYECGKPKPVGELVFKFKANTYTFTKFLLVEVGAKQIYKDKVPSNLDLSHQRVSAFEFGKYVYFIAEDQDCADLSQRRLLVLKTDSHEITLEETILTSNMEESFFSRAGKLYYWSEWFCNIANQDIQAKGPYVFEFNPQDSKFKAIHFLDLRG
jgi:hypothetical protein